MNYPALLPGELIAFNRRCHLLSEMYSSLTGDAIPNIIYTFVKFQHSTTGVRFLMLESIRRTFFLIIDQILKCGVPFALCSIL